MRNFKRLIFGVLLIFVVGYAVFDYFYEKKTLADQAQNSVLWNFSADQVQFVQLKTDRELIELERSAEGWKIIQPIQEIGDSETITQFIEGLVTEKSTEKIQDANLKIFDLLEPKGSVTVRNNLNESFKILISKKKNFQGDSYIQKAEENSVYVASSTWFLRAEKASDEFRDHRWAKVQAADVDFIRVHKESENLEIQKKDGNWIFLKHPDWKIDQNKIRKHITSLTANRVQKFSVTADSKPLMNIELMSSGKSLWRGDFGINKDKKHFLKIAKDRSQFEILAQDANEIYRITEDSIRDRTEAFQFRPEDVQQIEFIGPDGQSISLDPEKFKAAIRKILSFEILEFTRISAHDFQKDPSRLVFRDGKAQVVFEMAWGRSEHRKIAGLEQLVYRMKTNVFPEVFYVGESLIKDLKWTESKNPENKGIK